MIKPQTLKRTWKTTRVPDFQGSLFTFLPEEEEADTASAKRSRKKIANRMDKVRETNRLAGAFDHPPRYRNVVAGWSDPWRERWGRRANSLEDHGLTWRDAETQAFIEVWNQIRQNAGCDDATFSRS